MPPDARACEKTVRMIVHLAAAMAYLYPAARLTTNARSNGADLENPVFFQVTQPCRFLGRPAATAGLVRGPVMSDLLACGAGYWPLSGQQRGLSPQEGSDSGADINAGLVGNQRWAPSSRGRSGSVKSQDRLLPPISPKQLTLTLATPKSSVKDSRARRR